MFSTISVDWTGMVTPRPPAREPWQSKPALAVVPLLSAFALLAGFWSMVIIVVAVIVPTTGFDAIQRHTQQVSIYLA